MTILTGVIPVEDLVFALELSQQLDLSILGQVTPCYLHWMTVHHHAHALMRSCPLHPQSYRYLQADSKEGQPNLPVVNTLDWELNENSKVLRLSRGVLKADRLCLPKGEENGFNSCMLSSGPFNGLASIGLSTLDNAYLGIHVTYDNTVRQCTCQV